MTSNENCFYRYCKCYACQLCILKRILEGQLRIIKPIGKRLLKFEKNSHNKSLSNRTAKGPSRIVRQYGQSRRIHLTERNG